MNDFFTSYSGDFSQKVFIIVNVRESSQTRMLHGVGTAIGNAGFTGIPYLLLLHLIHTMTFLSFCNQVRQAAMMESQQSLQFVMSSIYIPSLQSETSWLMAPWMITPSIACFSNAISSHFNWRSHFCAYASFVFPVSNSIINRELLFESILIVTLLASFCQSEFLV